MDAKTYTRTLIVRTGVDAGIHRVTCVNDRYYICDRCGMAGGERWAVVHQFPSDGPSVLPVDENGLPK